jgi:hypothetical protein
MGLLLLLPLAFVIAGVLGARSLLVTLAAITLLQLVFISTGGDTSPLPGPQALYEVTLPWLAGHGLFEVPSPPSIAIALAFALSYAGGLRIAQGRSGLTRWNLGQIVALVVLMIMRQPLMVGVAGLLFLGQAMLQPGILETGTDDEELAVAARFLRWVQPWLMAVMLAAAWGLRNAGTGG